MLETVLRKYDIKTVSGVELRELSYNGFSAYALYGNGRIITTGLRYDGLCRLIGLLMDTLSIDDISRSTLYSKRKGARFCRTRYDWFPNTPMDEEILELPELDTDRFDNHVVSELLPDYILHLYDVLPDFYPPPQTRDLLPAYALNQSRYESPLDYVLRLEARVNE